MDNEIKTNTIGKDFTLKQLAKFVAAPVLTRLLVSVFQTLDDSLFISRYCGQNALAAFSVALPWFMLVDAVSMLCGAVSISCSIKMGQKKQEEAKSDFTTMCIITFCVGLVFTLILTLFRDKILVILGETPALLPYAKQYMDVSRFYAPLVLLSAVFNNFYVISGKPKCSMYVNVIQTFCNIFFDWLFIVKLNTGIVGAAYANAIGFACVVLFGLIFFSDKRREMCFGKPHNNIKPLLKSVFRLGRTQAITSIAISLHSFIVNNVMLGLAGEQLVAAHTIVNNVFFMFLNSLFGLVGATSPIISYAFGEKNSKRLTKTVKQVAILIGVLIVIIACIYFFGRNIIISLYLKEGSAEEVRQMADYGMKVAPFAFIFIAYNVFIQDFFNACANTKVATTLSVIENVILSNLSVIILPRIFGVTAIWYTLLVVEFITFFFSAESLYKSRYLYGFNAEGIATFTDK
ncbi:MAG: MATE family efflux transporter [Erysipelotrichaceae bacterium]|nr:MATE family efflux transporter [Erysipelotrichaceae bacterium]